MAEPASYLAMQEIRRRLAVAIGQGRHYLDSVPTDMLAEALEHLDDKLFRVGQELVNRGLVIDDVARLHRKVTRYTIAVTEEYTSYASLEEAREAWAGYYEPESTAGDAFEFAYDTFNLCAECSENVSREMKENGFDEWSYPEHWPCKTARALGATA